MCVCTTNTQSSRMCLIYYTPIKKYTFNPHQTQGYTHMRQIKFKYCRNAEGFAPKEFLKNITQFSFNWRLKKILEKK